MSKPMTLDQVKLAMLDMTGSLDMDNEGDQAAILLLSATQVGTSVAALTEFTKLPRAKVQQFVGRLRKNGVFKGGKISADWFGENGGIAFHCDVLVATGMLERATQP